MTKPDGEASMEKWGVDNLGHEGFFFHVEFDPFKLQRL